MQGIVLFKTRSELQLLNNSTKVRAKKYLYKEGMFLC